MTLEQILARLGEIRSALEAGNLTDEQIAALKSEIASLEARKLALEERCRHWATVCFS